MRPLSLGLGLRGPFHHKPQDIGSKEKLWCFRSDANRARPSSDSHHQICFITRQRSYSRAINHHHNVSTIYNTSTIWTDTQLNICFAIFLA